MNQYEAGGEVLRMFVDAVCGSRCARDAINATSPTVAKAVVGSTGIPLAGEVAQVAVGCAVKAAPEKSARVTATIMGIPLLATAATFMPVIVAFGSAGYGLYKLGQWVAKKL